MRPKGSRFLTREFISLNRKVSIFVFFFDLREDKGEMNLMQESVMNQLKTECFQYEFLVTIFISFGEI